MKEKVGDIKEIVDGLLKLQLKYAKVHRSTTTRGIFLKLVKSGIYELDFDSEVIREPLIEHVGHLPIIASYLHPKIKNKNNVYLGRSLTMLAIHDIGETVTGDILTYDKRKIDSEIEKSEAQKLIPESLLDFYNEFGEMKSYDAKFAKSIDSIAPIIHDYTIPEIVTKRMNYLGFSIQDIIDKQQECFQWDPVLRDIFDYLMKGYKKIHVKDKRGEIYY